MSSENSLQFQPVVSEYFRYVNRSVFLHRTGNHPGDRPFERDFHLFTWLIACGLGMQVEINIESGRIVYRRLGLAVLPEDAVNGLSRLAYSHATGQLHHAG